MLSQGQYNSSKQCKLGQVCGFLKISLAGQFQKLLVGGRPKPQDHPHGGDGCAFETNAFGTLFYRRRQDAPSVF
jgi:hypothetical protein